MYTHVQEYQKAAANLLRAKLKRQPVFAAFYRMEMAVAKDAIRLYKPAQL